jgi:hypothetical protein
MMVQSLEIHTDPGATLRRVSGHDSQEQMLSVTFDQDQCRAPIDGMSLDAHTVLRSSVPKTSKLRILVAPDGMHFFDGATMRHYFHAPILAVIQAGTAA